MGEGDRAAQMTERKIVVDGKQVAIYLALTPGAVKQLVHRGEIPHFRVGRSVRFDLNEIDKWIDQNTYRRRR